MKSSTRRSQLRVPPLVRWMVGAVTIVYGAGVVLYWIERGPSLAAVGMSLLVALFAIGYADAVLTRLDLGGDALVLRTLTGVKTIERERIASVGWEAGVGVSLKLVDGGWVKLPYLGNGQGSTNTIRAWLKEAT